VLGCVVLCIVECEFIVLCFIVYVTLYRVALYRSVVCCIYIILVCSLSPALLLLPAAFVIDVRQHLLSLLTVLLSLLTVLLSLLTVLLSLLTVLLSLLTV
jgi:hypothetical protein